MDLTFAGMLNRGETLKLRDLNSAFQNPKTISLAYFEALAPRRASRHRVRRRRPAQADSLLRPGSIPMSR
jgi:hypothetical protein